MGQCILVARDTPKVTRGQWVGYIPRKGETVLRPDGQKWLIEEIELSWNDSGELITLVGTRLHPLIGGR